MPLKMTHEMKEEKFKSLEKIHNIIPDTKCKRRNICCNSGCPPMYFVEFIYIFDYINNNIKKDSLSDVVGRCIDNYFSDEVIKPCPLFEDGCVIYDARPINCRLYGQIPEEEYKDRQNRGSNEYVMSAKEIQQYLGLDSINDVPLYEQCPYVEPFDGTGEVIDMDIYNNIFEIVSDIEHDFLNKIDLDIDITSYKNFHDHYLWFTIGEDMLEQWTVLKIHLSNDQILKNDFVQKMKDGINGVNKPQLEIV